jgi:hypothetical protein
MDAQGFLALAAGVRQVVEGLKPGLTNLSKRFGWSDGAYDALIQSVAMALGVVLAFVTHANLLPVSLTDNAIIGQAVTGIVIGLGSDVVNLVITFLYSYERPAAPAVPPPVA